MIADKHIVENQALAKGFTSIGIAKAEMMEDEAKKLEIWLSKSYHGKMSYMENHFDKRVDPTKLVPGAKSVISFLYNYNTEESQVDPEAPKISKYAYGRDYHKVIKKKLLELVMEMQEVYGNFTYRCFVDSAPVLERDWAKRSGLGWIGKHTLMIHPKKGSYFFLAEIICDLEFEYDDGPMDDYCGTCTRCIDACPTDAISPQGYIVDGSKCISYLTIELKEAIPDTFEGKMDNWMFGCDICQDVCPWNRFATPHQEADFLPHEDLLKLSADDWDHLEEETFGALFKGSAVKRTKYAGLKRNIKFLQKGRPNE